MEMEWPRKVFLESTALFQLGSKLQKPEFAKLLELKGLLKFDLVVSEVSFAEYVRQRADRVDELARDVQSVGKRLGEWDQDPQAVNATLGQLGAFRKTINDLYLKRAAAADIKILGIPDVDVRRLFRMSIERTAPFETSPDDRTEKGFRDALIMFTILENIRERRQDFSLVVTNDVRLATGLANHAEEFKTRLEVVSSLDDANKHIEGRLDSWYRKHLREQSEAAKAELAKYSKEITDQVAGIRELTDADLGIGGLAGLLGGPRLLEPGESLERVNSLRLDQVDSAVWSDKDKPDSQIVFRLRCTASVVMSVSAPFRWTAPTKYAVGAEKQQSAPLTFRSILSTPTQQRERTLPVTLYGEARLHQDGAGWKLVGMKVDTSHPSSTDVATLLHLL